MPKRPSVTTLQASTVDILNVIRANASGEYQNLVPKITDVNGIPKVGEILFGYPALANQFIASLMNRIALVRVKSATFNNKFARFKKGYLEFGETVEEIFVELAKVQRFDPTQAAAREFKRTHPDVRTAFHRMNWQVQYPITVTHQQLRTAFTSEAGVRDLIERIINSVYVAAEYDEWLLTKYLIIKAVTSGKMHPIGIPVGNLEEAAIEFRGTSNMMEFIRTDLNSAGVHTATPKSKQAILMDSKYNARYDVSVLANAFNMEKAEFKGKLTVVDDFTTFDNDRWAEITAECDGIETVTADELNLMRGVQAILVDEDWFQIYDNLTEMTETHVGSGMYWNYWLNIFKTVSFSPFANAVVFCDEAAAQGPAAQIRVRVSERTTSGTSLVYTLIAEQSIGCTPMDGNHVQSEEATTEGVAVHRYGVYIFPNADANGVPIMVQIGNTLYSSEGSTLSPEDDVDTILTLNKV